jgi:hypothetical protein
MAERNMKGYGWLTVAENVSFNGYLTSEKSNSSYIYLFSHTIAHILSLLSDSLVPVSKLLGMLEGDQWQQISIEMYFWCQKGGKI